MPPRIRAGALRHRVTIERDTETRATDGGVVRVAATIDTIWAEVQPLTGREYFDAMQVNSDLTHKVRMRANTNVTTSDRIVHDSRNLHVISVRDIDERGHEMVLLCKELKT